MKYTKTTVTVQLTLESHSDSSEENVVHRVSYLNDFMDTPLNVEVEGDDIKVLDSKEEEGHTMLTHKYKANSVSELLNNLATPFPYQVMRLLSEQATVVDIDAQDEEVEVAEKEVDDE